MKQYHMNETLQAFAAMHDTRQFHKLTLEQLKTMCEFVSEHYQALQELNRTIKPENGYWVGAVFHHLPESADKHSADVDPVLDYINQHTILRHMTPPFTEPVETVAIDTPRCCNCGLPAETSRAGMQWCRDCLTELDEGYEG